MPPVNWSLTQGAFPISTSHICLYNTHRESGFILTVHNIETHSFDLVTIPCQLEEVIWVDNGHFHLLAAHYCQTVVTDECVFHGGVIQHLTLQFASEGGQVFIDHNFGATGIFHLFLCFHNVDLCVPLHELCHYGFGRLDSQWHTLISSLLMLTPIRWQVFTTI